ncbi:hypothetical protein F7725_009357 [Dissostichus mawsoni]|uniref:G-patch domain-containing protein n=1 Tax=Dissostichus mawsoni TaxID=36200 RepID=A0A7J5ZAW3_DISMA|nr:hypothetical protein F7725_009357 [Dissostichus mawsoni]
MPKLQVLEHPSPLQLSRPLHQNPPALGHFSEITSEEEEETIPTEEERNKVLQKAEKISVTKQEPQEGVQIQEPLEEQEVTVQVESGGRRSRKSRSPSPSRGRRRPTYSQRDRWKREPSHSPVLILRKNRSPNRKLCSSSNSPQRISELDKEQLLEIAKANAAAMCAKAGLPIPASLRSTVPPLTLPHGIAMNAAMASMTAAPSGSSQPTSAALEEVKRKVAKQANSISIKEFTDKCKMIVDSKGELPVAIPHVSDEEDDGNLSEGQHFENRRPSASASTTPQCVQQCAATREWPRSFLCLRVPTSEEGGRGTWGLRRWVPVDKASEKAAAASRKALTTVSKATASPSSSSADTATAGESAEAVEQSVTDSDSVFPDPLLQVDAWAQSNTVPGLFTGSTGATVLTSEELSTSGPQAWLKKGSSSVRGVGEFLMRKMGWRTGEGLGRNREGTVEPIIIDFKVDRKGLVAEGEKPQKQTGGLVVTKDLMGKGLTAHTYHI